MLLPIIHPIHGRRESRKEREALDRMAMTEAENGGSPPAVQEEEKKTGN
jgi:hypothetical protein